MKLHFLIALISSLTLYSANSFSACVTKEIVTCADGSTAPQDPVTCEWKACPDSHSTSSGIDRLHAAVNAHNAKIGGCTKEMRTCADGSPAPRNMSTCEWLACPTNSSANKICPSNKMLTTCPDGNMQAQDPVSCEMIPCSPKAGSKICPSNKMLSLCADGTMQAQDPVSCKMIPCGKKAKTNPLYKTMNDLGLIACEGKVCSGTISNLTCQSSTPLGSNVSKCSYSDASGSTATIRGPNANRLFSEAKKAGTIAISCLRSVCSSEAVTVSCSQKSTKAVNGTSQECSATASKDLEDTSEIPDDRDPAPNGTVR